MNNIDQLSHSSDERLANSFVARPLAPWLAALVVSLIFFPLTLLIGMTTSPRPPAWSPALVFLMPFLPTIVFPLVAVPLVLAAIASVALAIRKRSLPMLVAIAIAIAVVNGIGLWLALNYVAVAT